MMRWRFALIEMVNLEYLASHGRRSAILVNVTPVEMLFVPRSSVQMLSRFALIEMVNLEYLESLGKRSVILVNVTPVEMLFVPKSSVTMMMMLSKFVLTEMVNLEYLVSHGRKTATLVVVQKLEWLCVVKDSASMSSQKISTCSLRTPARTRAASLSVTRTAWRTVELSPSTATSSLPRFLLNNSSS